MDLTRFEVLRPQITGLIILKLDGWMVGWLDGWMVGWLDGWMVGWLELPTGSEPSMQWVRLSGAHPDTAPGARVCETKNVAKENEEWVERLTTTLTQRLEQ